MIKMADMPYKKEESFESMLRRFKRQVEHDGILREVRDRKHYEKPSERKRKKAKSKRKV
jgi:small subunit ribosomal protein S21